MRVHVVGVGTPHGDDAAGLHVARALGRGGLPSDVALTACERPLDLVGLFESTDGVVLVDATRSGRRPGTLHRPDATSLQGEQRFSTHALGVREALRLAEALGRSPARLELLGIEAESVEGTDLSPAVRAALAPACAQVQRLVDELRQARAPIRSPACTKPDSACP